VLHQKKWSLGVNRKASNIGVWGESGWYPLIYEYECINQTTKYFQRIKNLNNESLLLVFKEQEEMELDWYRKFKPILALDPTFTNDHVTAFNTVKCHKSVSDDSKPTEKENFLIHDGFKKRLPQQSININSNHSTAEISHPLSFSAKILVERCSTHATRHVFCFSGPRTRRTRSSACEFRGMGIVHQQKFKISWRSPA
jgi:hypothetical protein